MAAVNVVVTVTDPDQLYEGSAPEAPFAVRYIQVYRYTSEDNARGDVSGTLLDAGSGYTFTLVQSSTARSDPDVAGPYRYGIYDSSQAATSWYAFRFANSALDTFSLFSDPWEADGRPTITLRDLVYEMGDLLGGTILKGTAASNADAGNVLCTSLFKSSVRDTRFYQNWHLLCSKDAGGAAAAPEGEEALIASVDTATGTATLERDFTAAVTTGDEVLISAYLSFEEIRRTINRVREKMQVKQTHDIALTQDENRYPAPWGVRAETDIIDAVIVSVYRDSNVEMEAPTGVRVIYDGFQGWIEVDPAVMANGNVLRLTVLRTYRDLEGNLDDWGDTTSAQLEWLRATAAFAVAEHLVRLDPMDQELQRLKGDLEQEAAMQSGRYAPEVNRRVMQTGGRRVLPGPREF